MAVDRAKGSRSERGFRGYLRRRHDPLTSLVLTIPVFLVYHLGILFIDLRNGVDVVSTLTLRLLDYSVAAYVVATLAGAAGIVGAAWWLRRRGRLRTAELLPVLLESLVLALVMSVLLGWATRSIFSMQVGLQIAGRELGPFDKLVMAAGAGFHEELVFRVVMFAGGAWLLRRFAKRPRLQALALSALFSSVVFSAIHYIGPLGDPFALSSFTFRTLAGLYFAVVYAWRGFAVAVYTHALYDMYVFFLYG